MYLASATRPDILFAVSKLSRFTSNPGGDHWCALERVMHYLASTMDYRIHYSGYPAVLEGFSWRSGKQAILMRSTMEAELVALDTTTVEADWLHELLMDLSIVEKPLPAILMNCDNQTMIVKVDSLNDNMKSSRHIKKRLKYVRKMRNFGIITLDYIHTEKNLAYPFTKGMPHNVIDTAPSTRTPSSRSSSSRNHKLCMVSPLK
jgi:hypothetical protein